MRIGASGAAAAARTLSTPPSLYPRLLLNTRYLPVHSVCSSSSLKIGSFPRNGTRVFPKFGTLMCNCSAGPGGESDSRSVLDAFFLGKALAEAVNERIESTLGEFFSTIGRLQAEQQKQVQEFQEEVLERAKRAKEKAAREAVEAQGLAPKSSSMANGIVSSYVAGTEPGTMMTSSQASSDATPEKKDPFMDLLNGD